MSKTILFLGIGNAQYDAICYLKEKGHTVFTAANSPSGRGRDVADCFYEVDIAHVDAICDLAKSLQVDVVLSVGSDLGAATAAEVSDRLGLPSLVSADSVKLFTDKGNFRSFLRNNDLPIPKFTLLDNHDMWGWEQWKHFPAIVKPADSQGQRGVSLVYKKEDLPAAVERANAYSGTGKVIIEEYIAGSEVSLLLFFIEGEIQLSALADRNILKPFRGGIIDFHRFPSSLNNEKKEEVITMAGEVARLAGIKNGPFYMQAIVNNEGSISVEAAPRLDGCHLWRLISLAGGPDLLAAYLDLLISGKCDLSVQGEPSGKLPLIQPFFHQKPGERVHNADANTEGSLYSEFYFSDGSMVPVINGVLEKTGYAISRQRSSLPQREG